MKRLLLTIVLINLFFISNAQQDPQFTQSFSNKLFPNPAVAGSNDAICATLLGRNQWTGFDGKPETYMLSIHAPFKDPLFHKSHGVGLSVFQDKLGQEKNFGLKVAYAYRHHGLVVPNSVLSGGIGVGFMNKSIENDWRESETNGGTDPSIPYNGASDMALDFDFGLFYKIPQKLYFGISTTHLNESQLKKSLDNPNAVLNTPSFKYKIKRHYYIMAGYTYALNPQIDLKPNLFVKTDAVSTTFDLNVVAEYDKTFWGGINYRLQDAIAPMFGYNYNLGGKGIKGGTLRVGYSYDITLSQLRKHSSGSHELVLSYCFKIIPTPTIQRHRTVRFL